MLTWAFQFEDREYFEGLRTLSTNGIDKPVLNVFRLLARLGGLRLALESDGARHPQAMLGPDEATTPPDISGLAAIDGQDGVQILLASHHDDWDIQEPTHVHLLVDGLNNGRSPAGARYRLRRTLIDDTHSNAHTAWTAMDEPQAPTPEQIAALRRAAAPQVVEEHEIATEDGRLAFQVELPSHCVCLIECEPLA
jgi:xylan 1,4-beta-xylosidase